MDRRTLVQIVPRPLCKPTLFECFLVCEVGIKIHSTEGGRNSELVLTMSRGKQSNLGLGTHQTALKGGNGS